MSGRVWCQQHNTRYPEFGCGDPARWAVGTLDREMGSASCSQHLAKAVANLGGRAIVAELLGWSDGDSRQKHAAGPLNRRKVASHAD